MIDGKLRKRITFDAYTYIEGIGGIKYSNLLEPFKPIPTGTSRISWLDYTKRDDGVYEYFTEDPCVEDAIEKIATLSLQITRSDEWLTVTLPGGDYRMAELVDTTGRVVWCEYPAADSEVVTIPIADIAHGIYIVALTDTQGNRGTRKVAL